MARRIQVQTCSGSSLVSRQVEVPFFDSFVMDVVAKRHGCIGPCGTSYNASAQLAGVVLNVDKNARLFLYDET